MDKSSQRAEHEAETEEDAVDASAGSSQRTSGSTSRVPRKLLRKKSRADNAKQMRLGRNRTTEESEQAKQDSSKDRRQERKYGKLMYGSEPIPEHLRAQSASSSADVVMEGVEEPAAAQPSTRHPSVPMEESNEPALMPSQSTPSSSSPEAGKDDETFSPASQAELEQVPLHALALELATEHRSHVDTRLQALKEDDKWQKILHNVVPSVIANAIDLRIDAEVAVKLFKGLIPRSTVRNVIVESIEREESGDLYNAVGVRPACGPQYHWFYDDADIQQVYHALCVQKVHELGHTPLTISHLQDAINEQLVPFAIEHGYLLGEPAQISYKQARLWSAAVNIRFGTLKATLPWFVGHEREDVVKYRIEFCARLQQLWPYIDHYDDEDNLHIALTAPPDICDGKYAGKRIALAWQDESSFKSRDQAKKGMIVEGAQPFNPKGLGDTVMITDFVCTVPDHEKLEVPKDDLERAEQLLQLHYAELRPRMKDFDNNVDVCSPENALKLVEYKKDGYFTGKKFQLYLARVCAAIRGNRALDGYHVILALDSATIHTAKAMDLSAWTLKESTNVRCFTTSVPYKGGEINLYKKDGITFRGLKAIAEELGIKDVVKDDKNLLRLDYINYLLMHDAFTNADMRLVEQIVRESDDISIMWLPKFHPELNPIELVWAFIKQYCRAHTDWTKATLIRNIREARLKLQPMTIHRYIRRTKRIANLYLEGQNLSQIFKFLYNRNLKGDRQGRLIVPLDRESET